MSSTSSPQALHPRHHRIRRRTYGAALALPGTLLLTLTWVSERYLVCWSHNLSDWQYTLCSFSWLMAPTTMIVGLLLLALAWAELHELGHDLAWAELHEPGHEMEQGPRRFSRRHLRRGMTHLRSTRLLPGLLSGTAAILLLACGLVALLVLIPLHLF